VTLYTRFGDVTGNGAAVAAVLIVLVSVGRSRREGRRRG
jgi:hypothetical protein